MLHHKWVCSLPKYNQAVNPSLNPNLWNLWVMVSKKVHNNPKESDFASCIYQEKTASQWQEKNSAWLLVF